MSKKVNFKLAFGLVSFIIFLLTIKYMNVIREFHMYRIMKQPGEGEPINLILPEEIFDFILCVNVRKGTYIRKYKKEDLSYAVLKEGKYKDFLDCLQSSLQEGEEEFFEDMKLIRVIGELAIQDKYHVICGLRNRDGIRYKKITFLKNAFLENGLDDQKENVAVFCEDMTDALCRREKCRKENDGSIDKTALTGTLQKRITFLAHEIRISLHSIYGNLSILQAEGYPENRYLHNAVLAAEQLLHLVNGVLSVSAIESGRPGRRIEAVTLEELTEYPKGIFRQETERRDIRMRFYYGKPVYRYLYLNRMIVQQILINLISNAVKYTENGGTIDCRISEFYQEEKRVRLCLEVSDTGIGIGEEFLADVWKGHTRERRKKKVEGSGLGLTLTKYLVEMLHGTVQIVSQKGLGTVVSVVIETDGDDILHEFSERPETVDDGELISVKRVLIAENEDAGMEIICRYLENMGIAADKTYDGDEVLDVFEQSEEFYYDAILMDIHMPSKNGIEAVREIRNMDRGDRDVPIVMMTAELPEEQMSGALSDMVNGYLVKPYRAEDVRTALKACRRLEERQNE